MNRVVSTLASATFATLALAGAASLAVPDTPPRKSPTPRPAADPLATPVTQRISGKSAGDVELDLLWGTHKARVYGAGVGVCEDTFQIPVSHEEVVALLRAVKTARFGAMPNRIGGENEDEEREREKEGERHGDNPEVKGRLALRLGPVSKSVMQMLGNEQSAELETLAKRILKTCDGAAKIGVSADSLSDGLSKLASGKLSPVAFDALLQRRETRSGGGDTPENWILRMQGRDAVDRVMPAGKTPEAPKRLTLSTKQFQDLIGVLSSNDVEALPPSVYTAQYTDLRVRVLNRERVVSGRRFGGEKAEAPGARQQSFDRIYEGFRDVHRDVQAAGKAGTGPVEVRSERESDEGREREEEKEKERERERAKPVTTPSPVRP